MKKRPTPSPVPAVKLIPIEKIAVPSTRHRTERPFDELQRSIAAIGLLNPIVVTPERTLVAGLHRLRACAALGWKEIPATVVPLSAIDAELAEIDENLCRTELTVLERAEHLARRKALYVARHPETRVGAKGGGRGGVGSRGTETEIFSFSVDAAGQLWSSTSPLRHRPRNPGCLRLSG
jgi:ParB family transcriptional regulator, chromosome partitioning protein